MQSKGGFTVDDGLSFRSFRFVSLRFVCFRTVLYRISWFTVDDNSTLTTFMTKWEESDLRSCYFLPFCIEDEEEDCVHRIGGSPWVRQIFTKRREQGEFHNLIQEMRLVDPERHFRYLRMSKYTFGDLLRKVVFKFYIIYNHFCIKYPSGCSYVEAQDL